jgi:hypothetical protein
MNNNKNEITQGVFDTFKVNFLKGLLAKYGCSCVELKPEF